MRTLQIAILTVLLCVVVSDANALQDTVTTAGAGQGGSSEIEKLAWRLKPGQKFNVSLSKTANIRTKVDTRVRKVDAETVLQLDWEVVSSSDSAAVIRQTLNRIRLSSGAPGDVSARRLDYDSAVKIYRKGLSGKVTKQFQPAIGLVSTFTLSSLGQVSNFSNEAGQEKKTAKLPDGSAVKEMLTGEAASTEISQLTDLSWQSELDDSLVVKRPMKSELGELVCVDRYEIKKNDGQTRIEIETSAEGLDGAAKVDQYNGQGSIVFNDREGFIASSTSTMTVVSKTQYRDMKVQSLTEVQTTMTLNQIK
jgi:hypothetical protein